MALEVVVMEVRTSACASRVLRSTRQLRSGAESLLVAFDRHNGACAKARRPIWTVLYSTIQRRVADWNVSQHVHSSLPRCHCCCCCLLPLLHGSLWTQARVAMVEEVSAHAVAVS